MPCVFNVESSWDTTPDSTSVYEIYNPDDQLIIGNGVDNTKKYDTIDFTDLEGGAPKGDILFIYKDYLCIAGDPNFPHRIWISHLRNGEGWSKNTQWIDIRPEDGGKINGAKIVNDEAIISKGNGRKYGWRIYDDGDPTKSTLREIEDDKGTLNPRAETLHERVNYYLDRNGLFTIPSSEAGGLTYIVQEVIDALPAEIVTDAAMGSNNGKIYVSLGDISFELEDTISLVDAVLVYDVINDQFYLRDNMSARIFTRFINSDNEEGLYFGDDNGRVFQLEQGTKAGSENIVMRLRTPAYLQTGNTIHVEKVKVWMEDPDGTVITYRTDTTQPFQKQVGVVTQNTWQEFPLDATGKCFQMEFIHANANIRPRLNKFEITYREE